MSSAVRPLVIDHYDSYTGSLVDLVARVVGAQPTVVQHDAIDVEDLLAGGYTHVVLSPGPGHPDDPRDFCVGRELLARSAVPVLGVCLGHQGIVSSFGGTVSRVAPAHGTVSRILHDDTSVFRGLPQDFPAVRYHSLAAVRIPDSLRVTAWCESDEGPVVMGVAHRNRPVAGVQFHPESVLTDHGERLVANFLGTPPERPRIEGRRTRRPTSDGPATRTVPWVEPAAFFATHVADRPRAFWLDGEGRTEARERFTYIGWAHPEEPSLTFDARSRTVREHRGQRTRVVGDDIFDVLDERLARDRTPPADLPFAFQGGWVGYLGYACRTDLPSRKQVDGEGAPDACLMRAERFLAFDHHRRLLHAVSTDDDPEGWFDEVARLVATTGAEPAAAPPPPPPAPECEDLGIDGYRIAFERVREALLAGDTYEANLTYRVAIRSGVAALSAFRALRDLGPTPYAALLRHHDVSVVSASPERFVLVDGERMVESKPIKGTTPRGADTAEDAALRDTLLTDSRFTAENLMVTDLVRHDLSTVCETGTVDVPALMRVESYSNVHQLVTTVRGRLRPDVTTPEAIAALFPPASMTGAPKRRTMELIEAVESSPRGVYSGALGWIGRDGRADLGVVIRTITMVGDRVLLGTGGAITVHSDPQAEYDETRWKIDHLRGALLDRRGSHIPSAVRTRSPSNWSRSTGSLL